VVALTSAAVVFLVWYPGPLSEASGATEIFLLLLGVDVALGPLLTLVVFNPKKKELRRDLAIILVLQFSAFAYGIHTVFAARPAFLVFNVDRFDVVYADQLPDEKRSQAVRAEFRSLPVFGPGLALARAPDDAEQRRRILMNSVAGGEDLPQMPQYYQPFDVRAAEFRQRLRPIAELESLNARQPDAYQALLRESPGALGFVPVKGFRKDFAAVVTAASELRFVELQPWR